MNNKKLIGNFGEKIAAEFLIRQGFDILQTNFASRFGEIDIIAQKEGRLYFIEVKTRTSKSFGLPEESLNFYKNKKIFKAIQDYLYKKEINSDNYQASLIAILIDKFNKKAKIKFWKNLD